VGDTKKVDSDFVADGVEQQLDPEWISAERLHGAIVALIPAIITLIGLFALAFGADWRGRSWWVALAGWLLLFSSLGIWAIVGPKLRYKRRSYRLDEAGLRIRSGLLFRSEVTIPRSRLQHTDVSQGPIARSFGLATLIVHTAGTVNASVPLEGLPEARAHRIRDLLLDDIEADEDDAV